MAETAKWYVVHTYSGYENTVMATIEKTVETRQLQDIIQQVSIPMETVTEVTEKGPKTYDRKVFPGYVLVKNGARVIYILNRSLERAKELAQELNLLAGRELAKPVALADYRSVPKDSYLAVQTTSVGMSPKADAAPVEDREFYSMIHTGFDAVYTPAETKFMRYIKDAGGKACNGLMMLLYQGVIGYELWNPGVTVRPETVEEAKGKVLELLGR